MGKQKVYQTSVPEPAQPDVHAAASVFRLHQYSALTNALDAPTIFFAKNHFRSGFSTNVF
jgi:hypothetical protein